MTTLQKDAVGRLRARVEGLDVGTIADRDEADEVESLLDDAWDGLDGSRDGCMKAGKLLGRVEKLAWEPPILSFVVKRHGGTVLGSTRAELQGWSININEETASMSPVGHRQVHPRSPRINRDQMVASA